MFYLKEKLQVYPVIIAEWDLEICYNTTTNYIQAFTKYFILFYIQFIAIITYSQYYSILTLI